MGICLGLQLLFTQSKEFGLCEGLGIIDGTVEDFSQFLVTERIPHVGWNKVKKNNSPNQRQPDRNWSKIEVVDDDYFYFVHSFFVKPANKKEIFTTTRYGKLDFCSSILKENIFACQFHPEKSGQNGLRLLKQFFC